MILSGSQILIFLKLAKIVKLEKPRFDYRGFSLFPTKSPRLGAGCWGLGGWGLEHIKLSDAIEVSAIAIEECLFIAVSSVHN